MPSFLAKVLVFVAAIWFPFLFLIYGSASQADVMQEAGWPTTGLFVFAGLIAIGVGK